MGYRVGQRVGCVHAFHAPRCMTIPAVGSEYTIRAIKDHDGDEYLLLREITNGPCACFGCDEEVAFSAQGFRPLVSDEIKNEHVTRIVDDAKKRLKRHERERAYLDMRTRLVAGPVEMPDFPVQYFNCRCIL